jgi:iron complex transport system permease protein
MNTLHQQYRKAATRRRVLLGLMMLALTLTFISDLSIGASALGWRTILSGLADDSTFTNAQRVIFWDVRLPYAVMALLVGAALGLAGAEMQTVLNNPLASPFTLGVAAAATFGASLALVFDFNPFGVGNQYSVPLAAFACAAGVTVLIQLMARSYGAGADTIILFGIALLFAFEALSWLLQYIADGNTLEQIVFWTMGSLSRADWDKIAVLAIVLILCFAAAMRGVWTATTLRGGEEQARALGVAVERVRMIALLRVSLLAATALCFVGTIGFVGLVGPHIARLALGEDHRFYLPGSALAGALMLSLASIASKSLVPGVVLPIGIVTALVGVPLFVLLVLGRQRGN